MFAGIFHYLNVRPNNETYPDMSVRFFYPDVQPYLSINNGQEILGPRSADVGGFFQKLLGVFLNDYRFRYDLSYPVIVTLTDDESFDGRGYDWAFGLEANIYRNEPLNRSMTAMRFRLGGDQVDPLAPQQRVQNTIIITAEDKRTDQAIPGVRITYRCGQDYFIGETDGEGRLATRFPYCRYGGLVLYSAPGYFGSGIEYDNHLEGITKQFDLELWPLHDITVMVEKGRGGNYAPLEETDLVMLGFQRIKDEPFDEEVPLGGFYTLSVKEQIKEAEGELRQAQAMLESGAISQAQYDDWVDAVNRTIRLAPAQLSITVPLAPGNYTIEAFLLHNEPFTIPEVQREYGSWPNKKRVTLPEQNFSMWMNGGAMLNESNAFRIKPVQLYNHNTLTFRVLEQDVPTTWDDLENYEPLDEFLRGKRSQMLPQWG